MTAAEGRCEAAGGAVLHGDEPREELGSNSEEEYTAPGGVVYREIAERDMVARIRHASDELETPGNSQPPASYPYKTWERFWAGIGDRSRGRRRTNLVSGFDLGGTSNDYQDK